MRKQVSQIEQFHQDESYKYQIVHRVLFALFVLVLFYSQQANAALGGSKPIVTASISTSGLNQLGQKEQSRMLQLVKGMRAFAKGQYDTSFRLLYPLAKKGTLEAQFYVGLMFDSGLGVDQDVSEAFDWYQAAAERGHSSAQHNLAVAYANGEGVELNSREAIVWWKRAANQGNADAQYNLGIVYAIGKLGVKRDVNQAKAWWRKAAIGGDAMAQYNLGILYANSKGSVNSYCEAARWWEESAKNGVQKASTALEILKSKKDYYTCW